MHDDGRTYLELAKSGDYKIIYERMVTFENGSFSFENFPKKWGEETEYWVNEYQHLTSLRSANVVFSKDLKKLYMTEHSNKYVFILEGIHSFHVCYKIIFKKENKRKVED